VTELQDDGLHRERPCGRGSAIATASRGAVVAGAVDEVAISARGWNVTVVGSSRLIIDAAGIHRLDRIGPSSWAGDTAGHGYTGIRIRPWKPSAASDAAST
jgi:uncharacterized protein